MNKITDGTFQVFDTERSIYYRLVNSEGEVSWYEGYVGALESVHYIADELEAEYQKVVEDE